jgi:hypothetical protein
MKSTKRIPKPSKFRPFSEPTMKVREVWSRLATTLAATAFTGAFVLTNTEVLSVASVVQVVTLVLIGAIMLILAIYVFDGADHD